MRGIILLYKVPSPPCSLKFMDGFRHKFELINPTIFMKFLFVNCNIGKFSADNKSNLHSIISCMVSANEIKGRFRILFWCLFQTQTYTHTGLSHLLLLLTQQSVKNIVCEVFYYFSV